MLIMSWIALTAISFVFFIYRLNGVTHHICHYIKRSYPKVYEECERIGSKMGDAKKGTEVMLMESFNTGDISHLNDANLQQFYFETRLNSGIETDFVSNASQPQNLAKDFSLVCNVSTKSAWA